MTCCSKPFSASHDSSAETYMSTQSWKARSLVRFGRAPPPPKPLKINHRTKLPQPHVKILTREFAPCRLQDHYHTTLQDDVMYMTYKHELGPRPPPRNIRLKYDPENPYTKYRFNPPVVATK
ncbi:hypothetical protein MPER_06431 [Moniliophthora perniciosa FA553]|nr:hypothetical protein MPER_06431 [Moniliophthora perniciosa FA553]